MKSIFPVSENKFHNKFLKQLVLTPPSVHTKRKNTSITSVLLLAVRISGGSRNMEGSNVTSQEPNNAPSAYYDNPERPAAFENHLASENPEQPGYPPPPEYTPYPVYQPQYGYLPPPAVQQQPQQQQQNIIIQNQQPTIIEDKMVAAILVTLFCFCPTGIAAIVCAYRAKAMVRVGNVEGACEETGKANEYIKISLASGCFGIGFIIIMPIVLFFYIL